MRSDTASLNTHAAATLRYIRASMEAAATLTVPGSAGIAMGVTGVAASVLSQTRALAPHWLAVWLCAALIASSAGGLVMLRQAARQGFTFFGAPVRKLLLCLLPALFAGAVLTAVLAASQPGAIPGMWLLLYGCAMIASSAPTTRAVAVLGGLFTLLGVVACLLPAAVQLTLLGVGFGLLHLGFGLFIGLKNHARTL
ncbi:MAG: hypothetical protein JSS29_18175 [Proteobacteria bacterium]|nr:hypothetical protein [Pseudomonadota bacterium]